MTMKRLFTLLAFVSIFATSFAQNTTTADKEFETAMQYCINEDYTNAFKHMLISANLGSAKGQYGLGICYIEGKGTTQNLTEGIKYIRKVILMQKSIWVSVTLKARVCHNATIRLFTGFMRLPIPI